MRNIQELVPAFMASIDCCNAQLGGPPACLINKVQLVQN